jgi:two-component system chemotaxis sensor kinase CheA
MTTLDPIQVFRTEAAELFEQIEIGLLDLMEDLSNQNQIDAVFRGLHTLKGSGAMFGFEALAAFTHHLETAFEQVRKGDVPATRELIGVVLEAQDHMRTLVDHPHNSAPQVGDALLAKLHSAIGEHHVATGAVTATHVSQEKLQAAKGQEAEKAQTLWKIDFSLPSNAMSNGTNPLGLLDELRSFGECDVKASLSSIPSMDVIDPKALYIRWSVMLRTSVPRSMIEEVFIFVMDDMLLVIEALDAPETQQAVASDNMQPLPIEIAAKAGGSNTESKQQRTTENVRVPAERLDELMDRVGELVIAQSRLSQLANSSADIQLRAVSEDVERLSGELRDTMMVLRMVPITQLFGRFRRLVHDLARETGKDIELLTEGESTEVDKAVIERLADPLIHLVRNSCDHGLETPEERIANGKSATGRITLIARQSGGDVTITIRDDGRGIDRQKVRTKAEASGLLQPTSNPSDGELLQLIFEPGFSTAAEVTNLSGRGVGMDVVKKTVETLRGTIGINSTPGLGSEVSLAIPLTLAIIDGLLVRVGNGCYVIPLSAVEECLELSSDADKSSRGRSFISLRESLVPFIRLRELFRTETPPDKFQKVVVISTGSERVGLVVDQIIGDHQTVIKAMSKLHHDVATFSGATILGDGSVALILDVGHLVAAGQQEEAQLRAAG